MTGQPERTPETRDAENESDAGAYIGHEPEWAAETIPGGVQPGDDRVAGEASQGTGVGRPDERGQFPREPEGHRQAHGVPGEPG